MGKSPTEGHTHVPPARRPRHTCSPRGSPATHLTTQSRQAKRNMHITEGKKDTQEHATKGPPRDCHSDGRPAPLHPAGRSSQEEQWWRGAGLRTYRRESVPHPDTDTRHTAGSATATPALTEPLTTRPGCLGATLPPSAPSLPYHLAPPSRHNPLPRPHPHGS